MVPAGATVGATRRGHYDLPFGQAVAESTAFDLSTPSIPPVDPKVDYKVDPIVDPPGSAPSGAVDPWTLPSRHTPYACVPAHALMRKAVLYSHGPLRNRRVGWGSIKGLCTVKWGCLPCT